MTKYQTLIKKIKKLKAHYSCSSAYFSCKTEKFNQSELALIAEALETIQFLEIVFKSKRENHA